MITPVLKPYVSFYYPQVRRLLGRKRMTIIAAFCCRDGLLMCADREESGERGGTRAVDKLFYSNYGGDWPIVIGGAGESAIIDNCVQRLRGEFSGLVSGGAFGYQSARNAIDHALLEVHQKYVWPSVGYEDHSFQLLIGMTHPSEEFLITTSGIVPSPSYTRSAIGLGADMALYFADRMYNYTLTEPEIVRLGIFILREVKSLIEGCGKGSDLWMLRRNGTAYHYLTAEIESIEAAIPAFDAVVRGFGKNQLGLSGMGPKDVIGSGKSSKPKKKH